MEKTLRPRLELPLPYAIMLAVYLIFLVVAFTLDTPSAIFSGFYKILSSRSILVTDYLAIGGVGATLVNAAIVGSLSLLRLIFYRVRPSGAVIMALWLTAGFSFFGKNVFNMIPLTLGVWLYARYKKEPFSSYTLPSLLVATLSPVVSEMSFFGAFSVPVEIALGVLIGFGVGFIFPSIASHTVRSHGGYDLYSMGFAGGLIATIIATTMHGMGHEIVPAKYNASGNNFTMSLMLYSFSVAMVLCGLLAGSVGKPGGEGDVVGEGGKLAGGVGRLAGGVGKSFSDFLKFHKHSGRLITDFYFLYNYSIYINMGLLCAFSTTVVLLLGAELSGIVIAGIFTMVGFGSFGKHLKNVIPVMAGAFVSSLLNVWELTSPSSVAAILFSTALAPMAGQFGWFWGFVAGFLHVSVAMFVGTLNGGLNLYNNGFAAGLVAMFLLPVITVSERMRKSHED